MIVLTTRLGIFDLIRSNTLILLVFLGLVSLVRPLPDVSLDLSSGAPLSAGTSAYMTTARRKSFMIIL